jgi:hypothetical protein
MNLSTQLLIGIALSALRPTSHGSGNRSIFECDTGKYEFTLRSPADHYHAALAFLPIKHVLAVLLEGVETLLQRPQHRYSDVGVVPFLKRVGNTIALAGDAFLVPSISRSISASASRSAMAPSALAAAPR